MRRPSPPTPRPWRSSRRRQTHRCRHVLPHRHRPYFHGGRGFDTGRPRPRSSHPRRDAGIGGLGNTADDRGNRGGRSRHHRRRPRGGPLALRRQARPCVQHQARHQRRPGPDRARLRAGQSASREQRRRRPDPGPAAPRGTVQTPDDGRVHAALRRGRRPADRAGLRAGRHLRQRRIPGRHAGPRAVPDRCARRIRADRAGAGRLHRLLHRGPARHRARHDRRPAGGEHGHGLPGRHRGRIHRRVRYGFHEPAYPAAQAVAGTQARADPAAAGHLADRIADHPGGRRAGGGGADLPDRLAARHAGAPAPSCWACCWAA